jgi:hypothetical protein
MKYETTQAEKEVQEVPVREKPGKSKVPAPSIKLFEHHTVSSKIKERKIDKTKINSRPNSAPIAEPRKKPEKHTRICNDILEKNKENIPVRHPENKDQKDGKFGNAEKGQLEKNPKMCKT